jgi:uncharacterized membrane protein
MSTEALLFGHLVGAFLFVPGGVMATIARVTALRRERPSEVAAALRGARPAVPLIGSGLVVAVGFGFWLTDRLGLDLGTSWLSSTFALLGWVIVVGVIAGRQDRHTRELAEQLAGEGDTPSPDLARRLRDPVNLALNLSLLAATVAIIAVMVWKP